jgi:general nucleoside transport system ATP-binding protein
MSAREIAALMVGSEVGDVARSEAAPAGAQVLAIAGMSATSAALHGMALADVHLDVRAGEIVAIAGIAGSGQSELFAALSGEAGRPRTGRVAIAGVDVTGAGVAARRAHGAAFVPEDRLGHATLPGAALSENLVLSLPRDDVAGRFGALRRSAMTKRLGAVVSAFDVRASKPDPEARRLSGGNLQKYVIGREILRKPKLLVVNQPTWGVDAAAAQRIRQALVDMARGGAAVLMISQDLDEVFALADRIAVIRMGRLSEARSASGLTRESVGLLMTSADEAAHAA